MFRNGTGDRIEEQTYPLTATELEQELGDAELELPACTETVGEVLKRLACEETFHTPEDVRYTLYGGVSDQAIGRKQYSDRDPTPVGSPEGPDVVSF
ncbi:DUF5789 family protein [Haloarchaeobius sp. HRN-SO-5]|uniref:DUF5789 family protein n=1 Tax=Haloarchaeobius sp. HRN-SO-5 TaxID=3446118 RepID=UPI003EBE31A8